MFHLFDKIYIEFDTKISAEITRIVISERFAAPLEFVPSGTYLAQIHYAKHVNDLIGEGKEFLTEVDFFKGLKTLGDATNGPLVVYCDKSSFMHLFISWHKMLLENISLDVTWKIFRFLIEKKAYLFNLIDKPNSLTFKEFSIGQWDQSEFDSKYNSIVIEKDRQWNSSIIENLGIETLLVSYVSSPTEAVKESLKEKILLLTSRTLLSEIYEVKFQIIKNYQNKVLHDLINVVSIEDIDELFSNPMLDIFADQDIWAEASPLYPTSQGSALNIANLNDEKALKLTNAFKFIRSNFDGIPESNPQVEIINRLPALIRGNFTDQELSDLLANNAFSGMTLNEGVDREKVNVLFVDWVLKMHRTNNTSTISNCFIAV